MQCLSTRRGGRDIEAINSYHLRMSVEDLDVVDVVSISSHGEVQLTISDHLEWHDSLAHQRALQEKLNAYLRFAESGELVERYPAAEGRSLVIDVRFRYLPDAAGYEFLQAAGTVIESAGLRFEYGLLRTAVN